MGVVPVLNLIESPHRQRPDAATVLLHHGLGVEAMPFAARAVKQERTWESLLNYGLALLYAGRFEVAIENLEEAHRLSGGNAYTATAYGYACGFTGDFWLSRKLYSRAFDLMPADKTVALNYAMELLRNDEWEFGWKLWEYARLGNYWNCPVGIERWTGQSLRGKRLLLVNEGGYGDTFLYMRFIPRIKAADTHVTLVTWDRQAPALEGHPWLDQVLPASAGMAGQQFDYAASIVSLGALSKATPSNVIGKGRPYLQASESKRELFRAATSNGGKMKVGICWSAEEVGVPRKIRSLEMRDIEPLKSLPVRWFSLQPGTPPPSWVVDETAALKDWSDTAALIANMDLVVTVDTAVAHLAGAMGKPVWILLPMNIDFKWGSRANERRWYGSQRLFHQDAQLEWDSCIREVVRALRAEVSACRQ